MDWRGVQTTSHLPRGSAPTLGGGTTIPLKSQFFLLALRAENFVRKNCPKSAQKPFLDQFFAAKILAPEFCHNRPPGLCRCCPPPLFRGGVWLTSPSCFYSKPVQDQPLPAPRFPPAPWQWQRCQQAASIHVEQPSRRARWGTQGPTCLPSTGWVTGAGVGGRGTAIASAKLSLFNSSISHSRIDVIFLYIVYNYI